jgi:polysaccharide biosynthesis/export protein
MLIRKTTIVFAAAVALGFLTPVPDARSIRSAAGGTILRQVNERIQCGANASNAFCRRSPRRITLGIGDVVNVTIFEAEAGGIFLPSEAGARPGNFVTLPDQMVDSDGNITVPYAGTIRAAGRTPLEVQQAIIEALTRR